MGLLSWIRGRRDETESDAPDLADEEKLSVDDEVEVSRERDESPYAPAAEHARILSTVRLEAEGDAIRHAEDMLKRQFPIAARAEATAARRLADLHTEFVKRDAALRERNVSREQQVEAADRRLAAAKANLRRAGIPDDQMEIEPLHARRLSSWRLLASLVVGVILGCLTAQDLPTIWLVVSIVAGLALIAAILVESPENLEVEEIAALREEHAEANRAVVELNSEIARLEIERDALCGETETLAEAEVAFAKEMAAAYQNAAFSAMPAGSLEGGRKFEDQRELSVQLPNWVRELEVLS